MSNNKVHIILDNVYAKVVGATKEIERIIWSELSFLVEEFGQEFPRRRHLFNRKTKKTYTGLVPYIERILKEQEIEYEIVDTREVPETNANFKLVEYVDENKTIPLTFRPYQKEIVDNCEPRAVIQAATGKNVVPLTKVI